MNRANMPKLTRAVEPRVLDLLLNPRPGWERAIANLYWGLLEMDQASKQQFESSIIDDSYLGPCWKEVFDAARDMLSGPIGRFSGGELDPLFSDLIDGATQPEDLPKRPEHIELGVGEKELTPELAHLVRQLTFRTAHGRSYASFEGPQVSNWGDLKRLMTEGFEAEWVSRAKGFAFPTGVDGEAAIRKLLTEWKYTDPRSAEAFFTPEPLARRAVEFFGRISPTVFLEPSAGGGALLEEAAFRYPKARLYAVEPMDRFRERLIARGFDLAGRRFEDVSRLPVRPDAVLMNPPFSAQLAHVAKAYGFLAPGGLLVAICAPSILSREDSAHRAFWSAVEGAIVDTEAIPAKAFRESGTDVATTFLILEKPKGRVSAAWTGR